MAHQNSVQLDDMRDQLLTLDQVREHLAVTEPLSEVTFTASEAEYRVEEGWADVQLTEYTGAYLRMPGGEEYQLTKQGALELGSACRIPQQLQQDIPVYLYQTFCNAALCGVGFKKSMGDKDFKLLVNGDHALALTRATISPFSNLRLLDTVVASLEKKYGAGEILADYKFHHDLEATAVRLIVPGERRIITGTGVADDSWSVGLQFKNSLIGLRQTELSGYLFRYWCTNGCIDTMNSTGGFARKGSTEEDMLAWAQEGVDEVLGGLESQLDAVQQLTAQPVTGDVVNVLTDLFAAYNVPGRERRRVIDTMADTDDTSMYSLMQAITQAANAEGLGYRQVEQLMAMGGHVVHAAEGRCSEDNPCRRLLPEGWVASQTIQGEVEA